MNYSPLNFFIAVMVVYRISRALVAEAGPMGIFVKSRQALEQKLGPGHWIYEGALCPFCISFWLSLPMAFWLTSGDAMNVIITWLGIAGAVVLVYRKGEN